MKIVVSKVVTARNPGDVVALIQKGYKIESVVGDKESPDAPVKPRRRRRRRAPVRTTPEMREQIIAMRKQGKVWRLVGRKFGVTGARAWQIANGK